MADTASPVSHTRPHQGRRAVIDRQDLIDAALALVGPHRSLSTLSLREVAREAGLDVRECDFSMTQVYGAQEAFCTGTYAGIIPVRDIDGRPYANPGPVTLQLRERYAARLLEEAQRMKLT